MQTQISYYSVLRTIYIKIYHTQRSFYLYKMCILFMKSLQSNSNSFLFKSFLVHQAQWCSTSLINIVIPIVGIIYPSSVRVYNVIV